METLGLDAHGLTGRRTGVANVVGGFVEGLNSLPEASVRLYTDGPLDHSVRFPVTIVKGHPLWTTLWLGNYFLFHPAPKVMLYGAHALPWYSPAKNIVVIHDLAFELFPDHFTPTDRRRLQYLTRNAARRANHFITVSQSTKNDLIRLYQIPAERISVVYLACNTQVFRPVEKQKVEQVKKNHQLNRPYLISVGTLQRRKNHAGLVRAWGQAVTQGVDLDLVLVGAKGWLDEELEQAIRECPVGQRIHRLGYVEASELPALYSGAVLFALPSLYEGFGLPVLEAMACGTPTITSNNSSLLELFSESAKIVNPTNLSELAAAIASIANNPVEQAQLRQKGLERANQFSWAKAGREIWSLVEQLANEKR